MIKDKFTINIKKLKYMNFPLEYKSFNALCYDIVMYDGAECSKNHSYLLKTITTRNYIKQQLHKLTEYQYSKENGKHLEKQIIYNIR